MFSSRFDEENEDQDTVMYREPMDAVPLWVLFGLACVVMGLTLEGGYRLGRWRHAHAAGEKNSPIAAIVASLLGVFGFLLAFTFGLAANHYEARRQAVLDEANAIGTAYLRTSVLPEPQRGESARLLREYVDVRIKGSQQDQVEEAIARSKEIHKQLWDHATTAAERQPGPITALYVQSLNQMIDMHSVRVQAGIRSRIPTVIWVGLFGLALLAMASVGYQSGIAVARRSPGMAVLVLAFAGVMLLIADLDHQSEGFLTVSQQSLLDLQTSMKGRPPSP